MICSYCGNDLECKEIIDTHGTYLFICQNCKNNKNIDKCEKCKKEYEYNYCKNGYDSDYESLCHECYLEENLDRSYSYAQLNWGYRPDPIFFGGEKNESSKLFMGIELETDHGDEDKIKEIKNSIYNIGKNFGYGFFWGKEDGSLSDNGIEFVSHPATLEFHKNTEYWKELLELIKYADLKSNDCPSCGIHIHMNRNYLKVEEINKLDALVNLYSTTFRRFARRNSRSYAIYNPDKRENNLGRNNNNNSRYSCLNFHNENTIEWRIFKGNTKYESIMALFELIQGTCNFIKKDNVTLPFIYGDKEICKKEFKKFLEQQSFEYLPRYTEMCRVWRDLNEGQ